MNIVHIEDFFHPNAGYQTNILSKYQALQGDNVYIITSELDKMPDDLCKFFGDKNIEEDDNDFYKKIMLEL